MTSLLCRLGLHRWTPWRKVWRLVGPKFREAGRWRNCLRCEREQRRIG